MTKNEGFVIRNQILEISSNFGEIEIHKSGQFTFIKWPILIKGCNMNSLAKLEQLNEFFSISQFPELPIRFCTFEIFISYHKPIALSIKKSIKLLRAIAVTNFIFSLSKFLLKISFIR
jgi:hypothetical protein